MCLTGFTSATPWKSSLWSILLLLILSFANISGVHARVSADSLRALSIGGLKAFLATEQSDTSLANAYWELTDLYKKVNRDSAMYWVEEGLRRTREAGNRLWEGNLLMEKARIYHWYDEFETSNAIYRESLPIFMEMNRYGRIAAVYNGIFVNHIDAGIHHDSVDTYFFKLIALKDSLGDAKLIGKAHYNYSIQQFQEGKYHLAVDHLMQAIEIYKEVGYDKGVLMSKSNLAQIQFGLKNIDKAIELNKEVGVEFKKMGDEVRYAGALQNLGACYEALHRYDQAVQCFREAIALNNKNNFQRNNLQAYEGLAAHMYALDKPDSSLYFAGLALALEKENYPAYSQAANLTMAQAYVAKGNYPLAERYALGYLKYNREKGADEYTSNSYKVLARLYEKWGKHKEANTYYALNEELRDSMFKKQYTQQVADMEAWYWSAQKRNDLTLAKKNEALKSQEANQAVIQKELYASQRNGLFVLFILLGTSGVLVYRVNLQRKKSQYMKQVSEMELKAVRAQMNPHTVFNVMSAIQALILKGDLQKAHQGMGKFGQLTRRILENSEKQLIPIEDEIMALQSYIEIESLRFPIQYKIEVDPELDQEMVEIPSMILQPYVENAIKHGIANKDRGVAGKLNIRLAKETNGIFCTVEDDGVGRDEAESKKNVRDQHYSMGTRLIRERLDLLGKGMSGRASVDILDVKNENGKVVGTRVELHIPVAFGEN
ncbi:MAG: histidine kinase [Flavobacteriales bacterium]|nr:histidine kinase [Flavobacteriales bacterium]MCB9448893.1 histidine kinase [Flavobacteriales bacterium]